MFRYIFAFTFGGHASIQWTHLSCFLFEFSLETTPQIFHTASNWLTLALAVQRYIYVCNPALAKQFCTIGYARMVVMCLVGFAVMHMIPRTLDRVYSIHSVGKNFRFCEASKMKEPSKSCSLSIHLNSFNNLM